ncbi:MAG: BamA/TamA family outer membrane protein [Pseudomonadota bacterium]
MVYRFFLPLAILLALVASSFAAAQELDITVVLEGLGPNQTKTFRDVSYIARNPDGFTALAPLRRAVEADEAALVNALQSSGFYAAAVTSDVRRRGDRVTVTFEIDRGERFRITDYTVIYRDESEHPRPGEGDVVGIVADGSPTGEDLKAVGEALLKRLWNTGFISAEMKSHRVLTDLSMGSAIAEYEVKSGPRATYGGIRVDGAERTEVEYIRQIRPYEIGEVAKRADLEAYREDLSDTGLFSQIEVTPGVPNDEGEADVLVRLAERKHRTLGGGLSYGTDVGPGASVFWENRNLLGRGETLRTSIDMSEPVQQGTASFRKQRPRLPGYYTLSATLRNEDTDAFNAQTGELGAALAKLWLDKRLTTEGGLRFQYSDIEDVEGSDGVTTETVTDDDIFIALSVPLTVAWNSQNNPLDPRDGFVATAKLEPFFGTVDFRKIELSYTDRVNWGENDWGTLAGRVKIGAIYGAGRADIPATERFYSGGGGSLRGYAFQEASPVDPLNGDVLGGASVAELNMELRHKITDTIQLALFSDIGGAFENNTPDFDEVLIGAGGGIRYLSPIGPLRVDIAIPVERRQFFVDDPAADDGRSRVFQDPAIQFYIAIGQPF